MYGYIVHKHMTCNSGWFVGGGGGFDLSPLHLDELTMVCLRGAGDLHRPVCVRSLETMLLHVQHV